MDWITLDTVEQVDAIIELSYSKQVVIFKHSTSCGISKMVLKGFQRDIDSMDVDATNFYFLDLIAFRSVSNYIADKLEVRHESPQMIIIQNGKAVHDASHNTINAASIK